MIFYKRNEKSKIITIAGAMILSVFVLGGCSGAGNSGNSASSGENSTAADSADAASGDEAPENGETNGAASDSDSFFPYGEVFYDGRWYSGELEPAAEKKSAAEIYDAVEYTPQMFYGDYRLNHPDDGIQTGYASRAFLNTCEWVQGGTVSMLLVNKKISTIPYRIVAGTAELDNALVTDDSYNWCQLYFAVNDDENTGVSIDAAYTVEDNTITFNPVATWDYNEETGELSYTFEENSKLVYDFKFEGPKLTLSTDTASYTLIERDFTSWRSYITEETLTVESSLSVNSPRIDDITGIDMTVALDGNGKLNLKKSAFALKVDENGLTKSCNGCAKLDEDGLFTFTYTDPSGETKSHSMVMFYCGYDGVILSDGKTNYYYLTTFLSEATVSHYTYKVEDLGANISDEDKAALENLSDEEIEEIFTTRENLLDDFAKAFADNGIAASLDEATGEILLDSSILFASSESGLSEDGKKKLNAFITAFAGVIADEKYDGFVSKVEVQGHTDTDGSYELNSKLSTERAENVRDYCLKEAELSDAMKSKLEKLLVPIGYSYDRPVYNSDGTINKAASRRVEFVFYINVKGQE
ncbi:MAG: OmpA family protein [Lachnospiraceae bacterium]|nr:OmpA family protein [Lachnospiraceae bacterium]